MADNRPDAPQGQQQQMQMKKAAQIQQTASSVEQLEADDLAKIDRLRDAVRRISEGQADGHMHWMK